MEKLFSESKFGFWETKHTPKRWCDHVVYSSSVLTLWTIIKAHVLVTWYTPSNLWMTNENWDITCCYVHCVILNKNRSHSCNFAFVLLARVCERQKHSGVFFDTLRHPSIPPAETIMHQELWEKKKIYIVGIFFITTRYIRSSQCHPEFFDNYDL